MLDTQEAVCALCQIPLLKTEDISSDKLRFCCPGCQAVHGILQARNQLQDYQSSALFQQALKAGVISNPRLLEQLRSRQTEGETQERERLYFEITDLWCPSCPEVIQWCLLREKGIFHCAIDYATDLGTIEFSPRDQSKEQIFSSLFSLGYHPVALEAAEERRVAKPLNRRFGIAAFFAFNAMMFSYPIYASYFTADPQGYGLLFSWLSLGTALPVLTYCAWPLYRRAYQGAKLGLSGMEALVTLGVFSALFYSLYELWHGGIRVYFDSMTVIIAFVLLGKIMEARAKYSAKEVLFRLTRALPRRGRRRTAAGDESYVPIKDICVGDLLTVLTGEKIILDGVVIEGEGSVDEAVMTGESLPVMKRPGSDLLSGTLVRQGRFVYRVTTTADQSVLQQIVNMVSRDLGDKFRYVRPTDRLLRWFVPVVIALAGLSAAWVLWTDTGEAALLRGLSILLISCPCAIGIAAPLAESRVMQALAELGAIVRNRGVLRFLGRETCFVCDKTGTLTEGHFHLLAGGECLSPETRQAVKGLALCSLHPVAVAIAQSIPESPLVVCNIQEVPGRGLKGSVGDHHYLLGSETFFEEMDVANPPRSSPLTHALTTHVYLACDQVCIACFSLGDRLRPDAQAAIAALAPLHCYLLSGDHATAVEPCAQTCGFSAWQAGCHPLDKQAFIETLRQQGEIVMMLGDGINDSPALTAAQIGISVVNATDVSIQVSDLLLTTDRLSVIPAIRRVAQKGHRILQQNLFWAFAYNLIGIGLATCGLLSPLFAAFAMVASSLIVVLNAQRI